jgi:hypothetical protein
MIARTSPNPREEVMSRRTKKAFKDWGPGDILIASTGEASEQPAQQTQFGQYDPKITGQFRTMLADGYAPSSGVTIGDTGSPFMTMYEALAQRDPDEAEATLALVVGMAVRTAIDAKGADDAALVAAEGVLAAMRFPQYRQTRMENQDGGFE